MKAANPPTKKKVIFHMDGDAFFVAVEMAKNPTLKGLPVVTGEERGIATALSYEAKALGVTRGMPVFFIKKNYPKVLVLPGDYRSYALYSKKMFDIVRKYLDVVEEYSIDECFADMTGWDKPHKLSYLQLAKKIQQEIQEKLDISVSIGVAESKVLAKVASKWNKPHGCTEITAENRADFLSRVPIQNVWGIGPQTALKLYKQGVQTALTFVDKGKVWVSDNFSKPYVVHWEELSGQSVLAVDGEAKTVYSSIQKTRSFHPATRDKVFLLSQFSKHIEDACTKARRFNLVPRKLSFFLKTKEFKYLSYMVSLTHPTYAPELLMKTVEKHFSHVYPAGVLFRTCGVTFHELIPESSVHSDLFGETAQAEKMEAVHKHIDALEHKVGKKLVHLASTQAARNRGNIGTDVDEIERNLLFL